MAQRMLRRVPAPSRKRLRVIAVLAQILVPVFVTIAVGFAWGKRGPDFPTRFITTLNTWVAAPCLIVATLSRVELTPAAFTEMALASIAAMAVFIVVGAAALTALRLPLRTFLPAVMCPNIGNLGLPVALFTFGQVGLALAIANYVVFAIGQFILAPAIMAGRFAPATVMRQPVIWATLIGLVVVIGEVEPPRWFANTVSLIGQAAIPLILMSLGAALASLRIGTLYRPRVVALLRVGPGIATGFALAWALGLEGAARGVLVLQCAMPSAVFNYLWAQLYDRSPQEVAGAVIVSTLMVFAALPLLVWLVV